MVSNPREGYNWTLDELVEDGYRPIFCADKESKRYNVFLVGVACPDAVDEWNDWQAERDDVVSFQNRAIELAESPESLTGGFHDPHLPRRPIDVPLDSSYDHGDLIAAIYHCLGCTGYDPRDLMGRGHVTKKHLAVILTRLWSLEVSPSKELSAKEWLEIEQFGNKNGKVQWEIPSWAGIDDLTVASRYKRGTYDGVMVDNGGVR